MCLPHCLQRPCPSRGAWRGFWENPELSGQAQGTAPLVARIRSGGLRQGRQRNENCLFTGWDPRGCGDSNVLRPRQDASWVPSWIFFPRKASEATNRGEVGDRFGWGSSQQSHQQTGPLCLSLMNYRDWGLPSLGLFLFMNTWVSFPDPEVTNFLSFLFTDLDVRSPYDITDYQESGEKAKICWCLVWSVLENWGTVCNKVCL